MDSQSFSLPNTGSGIIFISLLLYISMRSPVDVKYIDKRINKYTHPVKSADLIYKDNCMNRRKPRTDFSIPITRKSIKNIKYAAKAKLSRCARINIFPRRILVDGHGGKYQVKTIIEVMFVPKAKIPINRHRLENFEVRIVLMFIGKLTRLE